MTQQNMNILFVHILFPYNIFCLLYDVLDLRLKYLDDSAGYEYSV